MNSWSAPSIGLFEFVFPSFNEPVIPVVPALPVVVFPPLIKIKLEVEFAREDTSAGVPSPIDADETRAVPAFKEIVFEDEVMSAWLPLEPYIVLDAESCVKTEKAVIGCDAPRDAVSSTSLVPSKSRPPATKLPLLTILGWLPAVN